MVITFQFTEWTAEEVLETRPPVDGIAELAVRIVGRNEIKAVDRGLAHQARADRFEQEPDEPVPRRRSRKKQEKVSYGSASTSRIVWPRSVR